MFEKLFLSHSGPEDADFLPMFSISDEVDTKDIGDIPEILPILALKNTVLFPDVVIPITIGREKSINAVIEAYKGDKLVAVISQKELNVEDPGILDLYDAGVVAKVVKMLKMPDGSNTAIIQGKKRFKLMQIVNEEPYLTGRIEILKDIIPSDSLEFDALISTVRDLAKKIIELSPNIPTEAVMMLNNIKSSSFLLNFIGSNLNVSLRRKQEILEINDYFEKANAVLNEMNSELRLLELKDQIENKVRGEIEKQQRDYFLNQQLKTIQDELGQNPQAEEIQKLVARSEKKKWPEEVKEVFNKEIERVKRINPQIAEYSVTLTYLENILDLPWDSFTKDNFNLKNVKKILDKDHYGLEEVKERILEHLAVLKLKGDMKAPIICLVGPPGVGKTSLGKSVASALKRKFVRMSLGGLHDESEIRGHRRTYIGAMPGRIIKALKKAQSSNPVFILDEIDKIGKDFRGDPSSALLEVLDPEQNSHFHDNYLELEYDLSKVLFIATANTLSTIQPALLDRMEIIEISGYSTKEKIEIAKRHLVRKQREAHGISANQLRLTDKVLSKIITQYTRESGVRSLDRTLAGVCRSIAKRVAMNEEYNSSIKEKDLNSILGPSKYSRLAYTEIPTPGVSVGLAWTRVGGDILYIEAIISKGKSKLTLTGNLGDVMKESATTALSFIKANAEKLGIPEEKFLENDIHVHVPEGAIPKDGPSAGITMLTALVSAFINRPVKPYLAMTGEITLRGKVLPVGGIKEKILAAKRSGITEIILCNENEKHVQKINPEFIKDVNFIYVDRMEEVLEHALGLVSF